MLNTLNVLPGAGGKVVYGAGWNYLAGKQGKSPKAKKCSYQRF